MTYDEIVLDRPPPDLLESVVEDLSIIRRDIVAVLQETADVRASMTEFSSWRPAVSKRFVVVTGVVCFMIASAMVIYQGEVRDWLQHFQTQFFLSHS